MGRLFMSRRRDESGVIAIIVAVLSVVLLMSAAFAVDIAMQVNRKHQLNDTLDSAAQAGAFDLPGNTGNAQTAALEFAKAHDPTETGALAPNVDFWCIVASKNVSGTWVVETTQIPSTCYPGTSPYTVGSDYKSTGRKISCSQVLCAIPCVQPTPNTGTPPVACNTIRVFQGRDVPFAFAPAGGIEKGSTGTIVSVACKGSCGTIAPNPLDVAVVADRTGSMSGGDLNAMVAGIKGMLAQMTPSQQYVALGTIGRTSRVSTPTSEPGGSCAGPSGSATSGAWIPVPFSDNYLNGTSTNASSALVKGVNCLTTQSSTGTSLAAPMKAAARYLLGLAPNNIGSLPPRADPPTKVLIFETDGEPNEQGPTGGTATLGDGADLFSNNQRYTDGPEVSTGPVPSGPVTTTKSRSTTGPNQSWTDTYKTTTQTITKTTTRTLVGGQTACANLQQVATNARAKDILVVTIAYNLGGNVTCGNSNVSTALPATDTDDSTPVITSITPSAAQNTNAQGVKSLKTSYKGNATINQTVQRTVTRTVWGAGTDSLVRDTLAAAASASTSGAPSQANHNCATSAGQLAENADGDYFFCAASGTDMAPIFQTALSQVSQGIKLMRMP